MENMHASSGFYPLFYWHSSVSLANKFPRLQTVNQLRLPTMHHKANWKISALPPYPHPEHSAIQFPGDPNLTPRNYEIEKKV